MKKIIKAFTFIEILFVITIISFLSVSAVMYFHNFIDIKKLDSDLYMLKSSIEEFDIKVKNKEIYDYELSFTEGKLHYVYKLNQTVSPIKTEFLFNENTKEFSISSPFSYTGSREVKFYTGEKLLYKNFLDLQESFTGKLDLYNKYNFKTNIDSFIDNFGVYYFSEDNLDTDGVTTDFIYANTKDDKTGEGTTNFVLKNINNKLQFYSGSTQLNSSEIFLFFQKAGVEKSLKLSNN